MEVDQTKTNNSSLEMGPWNLVQGKAFRKKGAQTGSYQAPTCTVAPMNSTPGKTGLSEPYVLPDAGQWVVTKTTLTKKAADASNAADNKGGMHPESPKVTKVQNPLAGKIFSRPLRSYQRPLK